MFHPRLLSGLLVLGAIALGKPVAAQESCPNCPPCPQNVCPPPPSPAPRDVTVPSQAYPTLQAGIDAVADGGTVHVLPGNYLESVTIVKRVNLEGRRRAGRAPTITGADLATDVIHYGSGGGGRVAHLALRGGAAGVGTDLQGPWRASVDLVDVTIADGDRGVFGQFDSLALDRTEVAHTRGNGLSLLAVANLQIVRTLVRDGGNIGILIYPAPGPGAGIGINRSIITDHAAGGVHIVGDAKPVLITRSFIGFNRVAGITYERARGLVSQSTVAFNAAGADGLFGDGIRVYRSRPVEAANNEVASNVRAGIWTAGCDADGGPSELSLSDNTFSGNAFGLARWRPPTCTPATAADHRLFDDGGNRCLPCDAASCGCVIAEAGDIEPAPAAP